MSVEPVEAITWTSMSAQPGDVLQVPEPERDELIITAILIDEQWAILSRYGDDIWQLDGFAINVSSRSRNVNFNTIPASFRHVMKAVLYRYIRRGRRGGWRPKGARVQVVFKGARFFLRYLESIGINNLADVTPLVAATYVKFCKSSMSKSGKPLSQQNLQFRFSVLEALYDLSQYSDSRMPQHPWANSSSRGMAGLVGVYGRGSTPIIPDDVFSALFKHAYEQVEGGNKLLSLRDELDSVAVARKGRNVAAVNWAKNQYLKSVGWHGGLRAFTKALINLRTACYIVLASTSGCRNHELANLQTGAHHRTEDSIGTIYHWMRSKSEKTDVGMHDWMIPEAAVRALRIMERWSAPYQAIVAAEILHLRRDSPRDPRIAEAEKHRRSLFIGVNTRDDNRVRTLTRQRWDAVLKAYAKDCGLNWSLASHQFRRKFANYVAHSRFGDLRYLKEHYAHWSLDMTLPYAMDDSWGRHMDLELYVEIQQELDDLKLGVVESWMEDSSLAGGYGRAIKLWQRDPQNLLIFKSHSAMLKSISESTAIRSNGHAWCTADSGGCIGNSIDPTRCGGCNSSVIGRAHAPIYKRLYSDLKELLDCLDIGEGGRQRVERNLKRCRDVLTALDMPPEVFV